MCCLPGGLEPKSPSLTSGTAQGSDVTELGWDSHIFLEKGTHSRWVSLVPCLLVLGFEFFKKEHHPPSKAVHGPRCGWDRRTDGRGGQCSTQPDDTQARPPLTHYHHPVTPPSAGTPTLTCTPQPTASSSVPPTRTRKPQTEEGAVGPTQAERDTGTPRGRGEGHGASIGSACAPGGAPPSCLWTDLLGSECVPGSPSPLWGLRLAWDNFPAT